MCVNGLRFALCEIPGEAPGVYTLYDHVADPALSQDVAAEHPEAVGELLQAWQNWPPESARQRAKSVIKFASELRVRGFRSSVVTISAAARYKLVAPARATACRV